MAYHKPRITSKTINSARDRVVVEGGPWKCCRGCWSLRTIALRERGARHPRLPSPLHRGQGARRLDGSHECGDACIFCKYVIEKKTQGNLLGEIVRAGKCLGAEAAGVWTLLGVGSHMPKPAPVVSGCSWGTKSGRLPLEVLQPLEYPATCGNGARVRLLGVRNRALRCTPRPSERTNP